MITMVTVVTINRFCEHIAVMFGEEPPPWDKDRHYTPSTIEVCNYNITDITSVHSLFVFELAVCVNLLETVPKADTILIIFCCCTYYFYSLSKALFLVPLFSLP